MGRARLRQADGTFDSLDPRMNRKPKDLPEDRKRAVHNAGQLTIFDARDASE